MFSDARIGSICEIEPICDSQNTLNPAIQFTIFQQLLLGRTPHAIVNVSFNNIIKASYKIIGAFYSIYAKQFAIYV